MQNALKAVAVNNILSRKDHMAHMKNEIQAVRMMAHHWTEQEKKFHTHEMPRPSKRHLHG